MAFHEFLNEAQFHGSRRLAERKNRISWGSVLLLLVLIAAGIVGVTIIRYMENPAYLAIVDSQETVMKFPSVGICPEILFPEHKVNQFLDKIYYPPRIKRHHVKSVIQQLSAFFALDATYSLPGLKLVEHVLDYNLLSVERAGRMLTASCEEILLRCRFFGITRNCSNLFTMELTNVGFCCVFNGRSLTR
ncbi:hypothetical protein O0L34_g18430 [Tuta absoluta]|nr:hypothetical protein O0L34_g18430 [Tuta absoluta]